MPRRTDQKYAAIQDAILLRGGVPIPKDEIHPATSDFMGTTVVAVGREWLEDVGLTSAARESDNKMLGIALAQSMEMEARTFDGMSSFTGILKNIATKAMMTGYNLARSSWRRPGVCRTSELIDYKPGSRVGVSTFPDLEPVGEEDEVSMFPRSDRREPVQAERFSNAMSMSRQSMLSDDLHALTLQPLAAGASADRTVNTVLWTRFTANAGLGPTLTQDATPLFAVAHGNYDASSGAPTVATLTAGRKAMRKQADPATGRPINMWPKTLFVPAALETEARVLIASNNFPGDPENMQVVVEPLLDGATNGETAWYLLADAQQFDTIDVAFLGSPTPRVDFVDHFAMEGVSFKVSLDFDVVFPDFRGVYRKRGA